MRGLIHCWRRIDRRRAVRGERGVSLALVAVSMTVIMGMASLALDIGQGYWTRRTLIPATDAAALAAAQDYATGATGCPGRATTYLNNNISGATLVACGPPIAVNSSTSEVTVTATKVVTTSFGKVLGFGDYTVQSTTTARYGPPSGVSGLRPMGVCSLTNPTIQNLLTSTANVDTDVTITYGNQGNACGAAAGNWGVIDFGLGNGQPIIDGLIEDGYGNPISFQNHLVASCSGEPHCQQGNPGTLSNPSAGELQELIDNHTWFTVPIYNFVDGSGAGAKFHIIGVLRAQLLSYNLVGADKFRSLRFRFHPGLITGTCCGTGDVGGSKVVAISGVG